MQQSTGILTAKRVPASRGKGKNFSKETAKSLFEKIRQENWQDRQIGP
jgi:hypothetical protein